MGQAIRAGMILSIVAAWLASCSCSPGAQNDKPERPGEKQEAKIRSLIEHLVFTKGPATHVPVYEPDVADAKGDYRDRYERCCKAFKKLLEFKERSLPILVEHLEDKRQSINFRNHDLRNSVGDACYWNLYEQLQPMPENYSSYGYSRRGLDGEYHPKPYWGRSPFDAAGGVKPWLEQNARLSYVEKQIKCLTWLLDEEKKIGAYEAEDYFVDILPLEIAILEKRESLGEPVAERLNRLRDILRSRRPSDVPEAMLYAPKKK
jgi:hypothetical protein